MRELIPNGASRANLNWKNPDFLTVKFPSLRSKSPYFVLTGVHRSRKRATGSSSVMQHSYIPRQKIQKQQLHLHLRKIKYCLVLYYIYCYGNFIIITRVAPRQCRDTRQMVTASILLVYGSKNGLLRRGS